MSLDGYGSTDRRSVAGWPLWLLMSWLLMFWLLMFWLPPAHAHLLNSTQIELRLAPGQTTAELEVAVDLTAAFGSAQLYYEVSHGLTGDEALVRRVILDLARAIEVDSGGGSLDMTLEAFAWPDLPQVSFTEFWAAPMARFRFRIPLDATGGTVQVRLAEDFPFPRPVVLTGIAHGSRLSRWVNPGSWHPVMPVSPQEAEADRWATADAPSRIALGYLQEGFEHILPRGLDHILFVTALLLAAVSWRQVVFAVSGFTLAHSLTLILAATGTLDPPARWVEPAIAASILVVALENCWRARPGSHRLLLVTLFGLLHGLGFAGALSELGLPADHFWIALLTFNLGVELGQLTLVALYFAALWRWRGRPWYPARVIIPGSAAIAAVAALWIVQRWPGLA